MRQLDFRSFLLKLLDLFCFLPLRHNNLFRLNPAGRCRFFILMTNSKLLQKAGIAGRLLFITAILPGSRLDRLGRLFILNDDSTGTGIFLCRLPCRTVRSDFCLRSADDTQQMIAQLRLVYGCKNTAFRNGHGTGLFRDDDRHSIRNLRDTDRRPVAGTIAVRQIKIRRREVGTCTGDLVALDDDGAIMERC